MLDSEIIPDTGLELELFKPKTFQKSDDEISFIALRSELNQLLAALFSDHHKTAEYKMHRLSYALSTEGCELVKQYLLFLRDLMLEKISVYTRNNSGQLTEKEFSDFKSGQVREYQKIREDFKKELESITINLENPEERKRIDKDLALVENPITVYKEQFQILKEQFNNIIKLDSQLRSLSLKLTYIKNSLINEIDKDLVKSEELRDGFNQLFQFIRSENADINPIDEKLKKFEKILESIKLHTEFDDALMNVVNDIEDLPLIKSHNMGLLYVSEIKSGTLLKRWLNVRILPKYREYILNLRNLVVSSSRYFHSLLAGHNNAEGTEILLPELPDEIKKRKEQNFNRFVEIELQLAQLKKQINNHLNLQAIKESDTWNESLILQTYTQVLSNTESIFSKFKILTDQLLKKVHDYLHRYDYNRPMVNEQIVDFLKCRIPYETGNLYRKVFFDSKRFNDHFLIERKLEQKKLREAIIDWEKGFGNSILIFGKAHCGKTSFIDSLETYSAFDSIIYVSPNIALTIEGRKFESDYNLDKTLIEVKKCLSPHQKYCIIIDDLEYWSDTNFSLIENSVALIKHIDRATRNMFFVTTANSRAIHRLDPILYFRSVFTWEIELSRMQLSEFLETVLHRHETTQQTLLNRNGEELSQSELIKIAKRIFEANGENVGSSLTHWVGNIDEYNRIIQHDFKKNHLPYLVTEDNINLLDQLLLYKSITQVHLLSLIPKAKRDITRNQIGRFVKLSIIQRNNDGKLTLTPLATDDIYEQTSKSKYLKKVLNHYLLGSTEAVKGDFSEIKTKLQEYLLSFPFHSERTEISIEKQQDMIHLTVKSSERPAQLIKHLNSNFENLQLEFKRNL